MSEAAPKEEAEKPAAAPKPRRKPQKRRVARAPMAAKPAVDNQFAGVTQSDCCLACTTDRCVISTVNLCKHPLKTGDAGCGPITMRNREAVRKIIKHQIVEARG